MLEAVNAEIMLLLFACFLVVSDAGDIQAVHYFEKTADDGSSIGGTQHVVERECESTAVEGNLPGNIKIYHFNKIWKASTSK